jgi:hypothetical protein
MADEAKSWEKLMVAIDRGEEGVVVTLLNAGRCLLSTATAVSWLTGLGLGPYTESSQKPFKIVPIINEVHRRDGQTD